MKVRAAFDVQGAQGRPVANGEEACGCILIFVAYGGVVEGLVFDVESGEASVYGLGERCEGYVWSSAYLVCGTSDD